MNCQFIETKGLPPGLRAALASQGFARESIEIVATNETPEGSPAMWKGNRSFVMVYDLNTGRAEVKHGSWGGYNPHIEKQADADSHAPVAIPPGVLYIAGETGYRPSATIYARPENLTGMLPPAEEVSDVEKKALAIVGGIKSSYRTDYFSRAGLGAYSVQNPIVAGLVSRGFLAANKAGAIKITTKGRNARGNENPY